MVIQKSIDNLKGRPKEERTAVAGGIAVGVIIILLIGWSFWFIKKIQRNQFDTFESSRQDEFNFSSVRAAQKEIERSFQYTTEELRALRDAAVNSQVPTTQQVQLYEGNGTQFGVGEE